MIFHIAINYEQARAVRLLSNREATRRQKADA
jgi:hypothetical protein